MKQSQFFKKIISIHGLTAIIAIIGLFLLWPIDSAEAVLKKGAIAPEFSLLAPLKKKPMVIVYFFRLDSRSSREGLSTLTDVYDQYKREGVGVVAVSNSDTKELRTHLSKHPVPFPVALDNGQIFEQYDVRAILPTTYILGPGKKVTDVIQGGGPSSRHFITTVADRTLQLNRPQLAKTLFETALKADIKDATARVGLGRAYLKEGKLKDAEAEFQQVAKSPSPKEAILGKEGLAELHLTKGDPDTALVLAEEVKQVDTEHGLVHLIRGNIMVIRGKTDEALVELNRAAQGNLGNEKMRAEAWNAAGQIHSVKGDYTLAEKMYQEAMGYNPYSAEIRTNRGMLYEKTGQPQQARALYDEAMTLDPADGVARSLAKRMEQHLAFQEDMERQKRVDTLVTALVEQFKKGDVAHPSGEDAWSSRPMTLAFLDIRKIGHHPMREGFIEVVQQEIAQQFHTHGRVQVVEREMLDKLLAELRLGASELADKSTALQLGRLLSARLIMTGNLIPTSEGMQLSLRLIDPETSAIRVTYTHAMKTGDDWVTLAQTVSDTLTQRIGAAYPLKGRIVSLDQNVVIINLGMKHGIQAGTQMKVIDQGAAIVIDGKTIGYQETSIGLLQITRVEEQHAYGQLIGSDASLKKDQKVQEVQGENK
jgi:tetratricopeptide (TPR) repeat protein/peroxiredoxin